LFTLLLRQKQTSVTSAKLMGHFKEGHFNQKHKKITKTYPHLLKHHLSCGKGADVTTM